MKPRGGREAARRRTLPTHAERYARGKALRAKVARSGHGGWEPPRGRRDPVATLTESSVGRLRNLIPIRYGRMLQSPFTFYRGAAAIMAADLVETPSTAIHVQACGDCHLLNFGGYGTPEGHLTFDINDFDETLPAPWEWDVKRLAASFVIAAQSNRFSARQARAAARAAVREYRTRMAEYATMPALEVWHASVSNVLDHTKDPVLRKRYQRLIRRERQRNPTSEFARLAHTVRGGARITDDPPLVYHPEIERHRGFWGQAKRVLTRYAATLASDRRLLFDRYELCDLAIKVVGVGSVGTMCAIALFLAADDDPLFLQIKEARRSVLEPFAGKSEYRNHGARVVAGQRLMQAASDIFLGWTAGDGGRHFYVRQLHDLKISPVVEIMSPVNLVEYATACGWALARAHARSGDPSLLAGYMGKGTAFDTAVADFAVAYARQNKRDHAALVAAVRSGRIDARTNA